MFISGVLFFTVMYRTLRSKETAVTEMPIAETIVDGKTTPLILDRLGLWVVITVLLILIAYVPVFLSHSFDFTSPGFRLY